MVCVKNLLVIVCTVLFSALGAHASEVILKIACVEQDALNAFNVSGTGDVPLIDYRVLAAALNDPASVRAGSGTSAPISTRLVPAAVREIPAALQALYPEQGRLIGRREPGASNCWHRLIIDCGAAAGVAFVELGVERSVLGSLATGAGTAALLNRPVQQYTHGSAPDAGAVFTTGYSVFLQQLSGADAREWLERVMPSGDGIAVMGLRRSAAETRTDTLIIRIDAARLPQSASGMPEALVVTGWER